MRGVVSPERSEPRKRSLEGCAGERQDYMRLSRSDQVARGRRPSREAVARGRVRVMRQRTRARRGAGIPATKYRAADAGCSAREESRFSPKGATNACAVSPAPEGALRGHGRGRSRYPPKRSGVAEGDALAGVRNPFRRGGLHRTRPRRRICIRRAGRRTPESAALAISPEREARVREADALAGVRARLPETKPHDVRQTSTKHTIMGISVSYDPT